MLQANCRPRHLALQPDARSTASTHHPCPTLRSGYDSGQLPPHGQPSGDDDTRVGILIDVLRLPALRLVDTVCQSRAPLQANLLDALHGSRQRLLRDLIRKRVVRSTPTAFQTNPEHSRPLCDTVLQQHPIGHHGAMMANHHTTLLGAQLRNPEGFGRPRRVDQFGLRPIRSTPLPSRQVRMASNLSATPSCDGTRLVITERRWQATGPLRQGAQLKTRRFGRPRRDGQFGLRPIWMTKPSSVRAQVVFPEGKPLLWNSTTHIAEG